MKCAVTSALPEKPFSPFYELPKQFSKIPPWERVSKVCGFKPAFFVVFCSVVIFPITRNRSGLLLVKSEGKLNVLMLIHCLIKC